jgi:F0F1-type ATP synthase assembly protein I
VKIFPFSNKTSLTERGFYVKINPYGNKFTQKVKVIEEFPVLDRIDESVCAKGVIFVKKNDEPVAVLYVKYAHIAFSFGVSTALYLLLGFVGGRWLDGLLHTSPVFLVLGLLGGALLSFKSLFDLIKTLDRLDNPVESQSGTPNETMLSSTKEAGNSSTLQENTQGIKPLDSTTSFRRRKPKP